MFREFGHILMVKYRVVPPREITPVSNYEVGLPVALLFCEFCKLTMRSCAWMYRREAT